MDSMQIDLLNQKNRDLQYKNDRLMYQLRLAEDLITMIRITSNDESILKEIVKYFKNKWD